MSHLIPRYWAYKQWRSQDMCMGGTTYIWGAQINYTKMVLAGEAIYIYIHGRIEGGQRGLAPPKID